MSTGLTIVVMLSCAALVLFVAAKMASRSDTAGNIISLMMMFIAVAVVAWAGMVYVDDKFRHVTTPPPVSSETDTNNYIQVEGSRT